MLLTNLIMLQSRSIFASNMRAKWYLLVCVLPQVGGDFAAIPRQRCYHRWPQLLQTTIDVATPRSSSLLVLRICYIPKLFVLHINFFATYQNYFCYIHILFLLHLYDMKKLFLLVIFFCYICIIRKKYVCYSHSTILL
jgi:hypothetical protein